MKRLGLYLLCALPTPLLAGDVYVGFRVWEAAWSPGAVRQVEKQTTFFNVLNTIQGNDNLSVITADTKTATGTYAGPLITYVTDDKLWSFSAVTMHGQSSPQSTSTSSFVSDTNGVNLGISEAQQSSPVRNDVDLVAARGFRTYFKAFGGIKYQSYTYDQRHILNASISKLTAPTVQDRAYGGGSGYMAHKYSGPVMGGAFGYPISDTASVSCSLGFYFAKGATQEDSEFFVYGLSTGTYRYEASHVESTVHLKGLTYETALTTKATDSLFFQVSLRGQSSQMTIDVSPSGFGFSSNKGPTGVINNFGIRPSPRTMMYDSFYGLTFSTIYRVSGI